MVSALFIFGYAAFFIVPVLSCRPKEYTTNDGQCCPMCNAGTVVQRDCTAYSGPQCHPCEEGTFMNQHNGLYKCFPCTACDTGGGLGHGLSVKQKCTATTDTVCDVLTGYYCKGLTDSDGCSLAEKHSKCAAGQRIKEPGTSRSDTVCENCEPGFFSKHGVNCTAWKTCSESPQILVKEGNSVSDVVCGSASRHRYFFIASIVLFLIIVICLVITGW